jgi:hypothetical protein
MIYGRPDLVRNSFRVAPFGTFQGQPLQFGLRAGTLPGRFLRVLIAKVIQREPDLLEDLQAFMQRRRIVFKKTQDVLCRFQVAFGILLQLAAGGLQPLVQADAG